MSEAIRVILPEHAPVLTLKAARALLRILLAVDGNGAPKDAGLTPIAATATGDHCDAT